MQPSETPRIYDYRDPRQFLLDCLNARQRKDPKYSLRTMAREMGFGSHTLLVMLLHGKRPLRVRHASSLAKGLRLSSQERLYLQALIQFDSAEDVEEKELCGVWLSDLHPGGESRARELDEFSVISHWIHTAILAMTTVRGFDGTPEWIHARLRGRVTIHEIRAALQRLESLDLIRKENGRLRATFSCVKTRDDVADVGARRYHADVMELAREALDGVSMDRREFQAFSIPVPRGKIPLAKELIRKFRAQFANAVGADEADEVFQMNIQFFQLTEEKEC